MNAYTLGTLGELYLKLGFVALIIVVFLSAFMIMFIRQTKTLDKIYKVLYDENTNNLTLQSSYDIIEAQYMLTKFTLIETIMRIHTENNIKDPARQELIKSNLEIITKNLYDRDITVLSKLKYRNVHLHEYMENHINYIEISQDLYVNLIHGYNPKDIIGMLNNEYAAYINETRQYIEKKSK
ncbi:MAG: hypothetical protein WC979_02015 [Candidatus Pacearchaeota archaeon]|jgi:hypothetical protein|nr:hypothetical protein [Clostridia bacterium]